MLTTESIDRLSRDVRDVMTTMHELRKENEQLRLRLARVSRWLDDVRLKTIGQPEYSADQDDLERLEELLS